MSHFNVEEMVVDLFYGFDKSTKWKASFDSYCSFCDASYQEIIKHVSTRWLSLGRAVDCSLQQYEVLKSYFSSESMFELHSYIIMKWPKFTIGRKFKMHFIIL